LAEMTELELAHCGVFAELIEDFRRCAGLVRGHDVCARTNASLVAVVIALAKLRARALGGFGLRDDLRSRRLCRLPRVAAPTCDQAGRGDRQELGDRQVGAASSAGRAGEAPAARPAAGRDLAELVFAGLDRDPAAGDPDVAVRQARTRGGCHLGSKIITKGRV